MRAGAVRCLRRRSGSHPARGKTYTLELVDARQNVAARTSLTLK